MAPLDSSDLSPQFATAEYASPSDRCKSCNQPISARYYRVNGSVCCERCAGQLKAQISIDNHSAFVRGILFGVGGAILGLILYATFAVVTGIVIGYCALAVGWMVGKAVRKGSGGIGGRRYQVAAVLLTYAAVSLAAIPISISMYMKQRPKQTPTSVEQGVAERSEGASSLSTQSGGEVAKNGAQGRSAPTEPKMSFGSAIAGLALIGLASPFLELQDPVHGIIGLVILFVGIRIAWQLTAAAKVEILGPFAKGARGSTTSAV